MSVTLPTHLPRSSAVLDVLIAAVATALALLMVATQAGEGDPTTTPLAYVVASVAGGFLIVRRRYPAVVLVIAGASHVTILLDAGNSVALIPVFVVALFTAAERGEGRRSLVVAIPVALISALVQSSQEGDSLSVELLGVELLGEFTLWTLADCDRRGGTQPGGANEESDRDGGLRSRAGRAAEDRSGSSRCGCSWTIHNRLAVRRRRPAT